MTATQEEQSAHAAQQALVVQLLQPLLARRRPERILVLKHASAGDLQFELASPAQVIRLSTQIDAAGAVVQTRLQALPFVEASFDLVILHHVVADGSEPFLAEVLHVLTAGGDVVVSGLNSSGLRNRLFNRRQKRPVLRLSKVCHFLKSRSINVELCLLMGLGGFSRPAPKATWHGLGYPFADRVMLHGHRQSHIKNAKILRYKQVQPAGLVSATLDGCSNREAIS
ncbi:MAG: class I SAM-dependent methyltransferase [Xanthomonadales bacterium]|nr:class I SAM-dependent methyltransferase [Xanthomonadales bacterium]